MEDFTLNNSLSSGLGHGFPKSGVMSGILFLLISVISSTLPSYGQSASPVPGSSNGSLKHNLHVVASAMESSFSQVGEVIHYAITVKNSGEANLFSTAVTDRAGILVKSQPNQSFRPGETFTTTVTDTITQRDLDAGVAINEFKVSGKSSDGDYFEEPSVKVAVSGIRNPGLSLSNRPSASFFNKAGETITFDIRIRNTGNISVFDLRVTIPDAIINGSLPVEPLLPGQTVNLSASHIITQSDLDAGMIINTTQVAGLDLLGKPVEKSGGKVTILGLRHPELLTTAATSVPVYQNEGDLIFYTVTVKNTGNVTLNNIQVSDLNGMLAFNRVINALAPGETDSIGAEYSVTADDIRAGKITNAGLAQAVDINNQLYVFESKQVTARIFIDNLNLSNYPNPVSDETTIVFDLPSRGMAVLKVYDLNGREVGQIDRHDFYEGRNYVQWKTSGLLSGYYILKVFYDGSQAVRRLSVVK